MRNRHSHTSTAWQVHEDAQRGIRFIGHGCQSGAKLAFLLLMSVTLDYNGLHTTYILSHNHSCQEGGRAYCLTSPPSKQLPPESQARNLQPSVIAHKAVWPSSLSSAVSCGAWSRASRKLKWLCSVWSCSHMFHFASRYILFTCLGGKSCACSAGLTCC